MKVVWAILMLALAAGCGEEVGGAPVEADAGSPDAGEEVEPEPEVVPDYCSLQKPEGLCPSAQLCLDGACVSIGLVCSPGQPEGLCKHGGRCLDGRCWGAEEVCSALTPIGVCPSGQFCDQGECTTGQPCGPEEPQGSCERGSVCFGGACRAADEVCGFANVSGACPQSRVCLHGACVPEEFLCSAEVRGGRCAPGETCSGGECLAIGQACSLANPQGSCGGDFSCLEGACRHPEDLCSATNPHGFCAMGLSCVAGACVEQTLTCDPQVFDGLCPAGMECSAGHCHGPVACDDVFVFGSCPASQTCLCSPVGGQSVSACSADFAPESASAQQRLAIERTNELRNSIGLWSIVQDARINDAALAHAEYLVNEVNEAHDETRTGSPYFTGERFWDRMEAAGYQGSPLGEVISYTGDAVRAVDGLIATVYHREPFFNPFALDMGYGGATGPNGAADVIDFGGAAQSCLDSVLVVYPPHGAVGVDTSWDGLESPQPPIPPGGYPSGPIISVHGSGELQIDEHVLSVGDTPIEHVHLTSENDPNGAVGRQHYFLYANAPLRPETTHTVVVSGRHDGEPFFLRWSFTTGR